MSYQERARHGTIVACDCCQRFGAIGDRDWRQVRGDSAANALHLCRVCQKQAIWCETHQTYHLPEILHRKPCTACGGLFTAQVALQFDHCPSCRRTLGIAVATQTAQPARRGGLRMLVDHLPWRR